MAKCDLSIKLDEPDRHYREGEMIAGKIEVRVDKDVQCNGLEVSNSWRTHGRGNVDSAVVDLQTVFTGSWQAGQLLEYPFEVRAGGWPPTYHGHHINVDHYIDARAKIPWAFDPKASEVIHVVASPGPGHAQENSTSSKIVGSCVFGFILVCVAGIGMVIAGAAFQSPIAIAVVGCILAGIIGFIIIRKFMVQWNLGTPECEFESSTVAQGGTIQAKLTVSPKRNCSINQIFMQITAKESAVSGSGTNKTTYQHISFEERIEVKAETQLTAGEIYHFEINAPLPENAPPSFDLGDNQLHWFALARIDVPWWPDWTQQQNITVIPSNTFDQPKPSTPTVDVGAGNQSITFAETVQHLWPVRDDADSRDRLLDAITGMRFNIEAIIERRLLYRGDDSPNVYPNGHAIWARLPDPGLPMILYIPHDWGDEFEQMGSRVWTGRGTVIGWDKNDGRLQLKIEDL